MPRIAITPKFIFIDGRTGATLHTESIHEEILYSSQQNTPALSSYFERMEDHSDLPRDSEHAEDQGHPRSAQVIARARCPRSINFSTSPLE